MSLIALRLRRKSTAELLVFAHELQENLVEKAELFPSPRISAADFKNLVEELQEAQQETLLGGIRATIVRDQVRLKLEQAIRSHADYVSAVAQGDPSMIVKAGFELRKRGPLFYNVLDAPVALRTRPRGAGQVRLRWKGAVNAKMYEVEYCLNPITDAGWRQLPRVSAAGTVVHGLTRKEEYWFRVRALGSKGLQSAWSTPVMELVV